MCAIQSPPPLYPFPWTTLNGVYEVNMKGLPKSFVMGFLCRYRLIFWIILRRFERKLPFSWESVRKMGYFCGVLIPLTLALTLIFIFGGKFWLTWSIGDCGYKIEWPCGNICLIFHTRSFCKIAQSSELMLFFKSQSLEQQINIMMPEKNCPYVYSNKLLKLIMSAVFRLTIA